VYLNGRKTGWKDFKKRCMIGVSNREDGKWMGRLCSSGGRFIGELFPLGKW